MEPTRRGHCRGRSSVSMTLLTLCTLYIHPTRGLDHTTVNPYNTALPIYPTNDGLPLETTTPTPASVSEIFSFLQPGKSFVEYRPVWTNLSQWNMEFGFRTHKSTTFLLHASIVREEGQGLVPNVWVTLKKGVLHVTHMLQEEGYTLKLGKGKLNFPIFVITFIF